MSAKLHFSYGSMNVGKSTQILQLAHSYQEGGKKAAIYTAEIDNRDARGFVTSRLGVSAPAYLFDAQTDFFNEVNALIGYSCLLIDEAQFLQPFQVKQLHRVVHSCNLPVMCFGLRTDFRGEPFPGSTYLLALADNLMEMRTVCACESDSTMNARFDAKGNRVTDGPQILIGGNDSYKHVCAKCFYQGVTEPNHANSR